MTLYPNNTVCPYCHAGRLVMTGMMQECDFCRTVTMAAKNAVAFSALREGEEFVFEQQPETIFVKRKPEGAPERLDINLAEVPADYAPSIQRHNQVCIHIKGMPQQYGFCSPGVRVVRADERRIYGVFSWN